VESSAEGTDSVFQKEIKVKTRGNSSVKSPEDRRCNNTPHFFFNVGIRIRKKKWVVSRCLPQNQTLEIF